MKFSIYLNRRVFVMENMFLHSTAHYILNLFCSKHASKTFKKTQMSSCFLFFSFFFSFFLFQVISQYSMLQVTHIFCQMYSINKIVETDLVWFCYLVAIY